ncbi:MAG: hypothetical protein HY898_32380 [Deltaproteobacteria bacterium]|nr:hypothetical protein [Deltaproteobacteria bacterium]
MRLRPYLAALPLLAACSSSSNDSPAPAPFNCADALDRLDSCSAEFCEANPDDAICEILLGAQSGSLFGSQNRSCDTMSQEDLTHLATASCGDMINEAKLHASGKSDVPCPAYFPWCNELAPKGAGYRVNLLSFESGKADIEVLLPDITRTMEVHNGKTYQKLNLPGAGSTRELGRPAVPVVSFLLGLPPGTDTAWIEGYNPIETQRADKITLIPAQATSVEDAPKPDFVVDTAFYGTDAAYPNTAYSVDPVSTWRNYRVVRVTVNPFQYNPSRKQLDVSTRVQLSVRFADNKSEPKDTVDEGESSMAQAYGSGMVNYPEAAAATGPKKDEPDRVRYLVIAADALVDSIKPLVDLKNTQGLKTEVVKLSEVGAEPDKIKARIDAAYKASAIEYALLVGDVADLPMYVYPADPNNWNSSPLPSDYWYGLLAGDDLLAEVSIGRISAKTPEEAALHVSKTVAYETGDVGADWRKKIALVVHEQDYPRKYTECAESVRTKRYKPGLIDFQKIYGGEHATTEQLLESINGGLGILAYRGHGSETAWYEWNGKDFGGADPGIKNGAMTPVVFSMACLNMKLSNDTPSNAEQWVLNPNGGAVAFFGATEPSWTIPNHDFMKYLFNGVLDEGITAIGPLTNRARAALLAQYGGKDDAAENAKMYLWLGDPSLEVGKTWQLKFETRVGWCNLQWPEKLEVAKGADSAPGYGQVWVNGVTSAIGQGAGVEAALGYGPPGSDPSKEGWTWVSATYNVDSGNNDEYMAKLNVGTAGTYAYTFRFKGATDDAWMYCDLDGSQNGVDKLGVLTVTETAPPPGPDAGPDAEEGPDAAEGPDASPE